MTTAINPKVPLPAGVTDADIWEDDPPQRIITGPVRAVDGYDVIVWTAASQSADGTVGEHEAPNISVENHEARGMTSAQARELAALLHEAADEIDGW